MLIVNLVSWAGDDFSAAPGDVLDLPDDVAADRIAAGLASIVPAEEPVKRGPGRPRKDA